MYTDYLTKMNFARLTNKQNKYIVVHYTANDGDTAMNNARYFYSENRGASAHYFVDENEILRVVKDEDVAWHCGTTGKYKHAECRNNNSIGIEMCSRRNVDGSYYIKDEVIKKTQELVKYLMNLHSIQIENVVRHYDVTGKSCPAPMVGEYAWEQFKAGFKAANVDKSNLTEITGKAVASAFQMKKYLMDLNPKVFDELGNLHEIYLQEGEAENIRGDIAFAQACLETGFFKFGNDVGIWQNNFCGLGATGGGEKGESFNTPKEGVRAQIQHLKAYANCEELSGECIDPRFKYVARGVAPYTEYLGINENPNKKGWATDVGYGAKINKILNDILNILDDEKDEDIEDLQDDNYFDVPSWAEKGVKWAVDNKVICGDENGDLMLDKNVRRLEMCVMLERILNK